MVFPKRVSQSRELRRCGPAGAHPYAAAVGRDETGLTGHSGGRIPPMIGRAVIGALVRQSFANSRRSAW
jgi:hypothetical protein